MVSTGILCIKKKFLTVQIVLDGFTMKDTKLDEEERKFRNRKNQGRGYGQNA